MPGQWINGVWWPERSDLPKGPPKRPSGCLILLIAVGVAVTMGGIVLLIAKLLGLTL